MRILLANPRGFCAGVDRAIDIVNRVLERFGSPIYVRHEVVHNRFVVENLHARGAVFVDELDEVPDGATVIFSAHGVSLAVREEATRRGLRVFDATCPLVTKVHLEVTRHARAGRDVVLIGHAGHPEVEGTMGCHDHSNGGKIHLVETIEDVAYLRLRDPRQVAFATQTTLSMDDAWIIIDALHEQFPALLGPRKNDVCYATQNRQDAVRDLARSCNLVLVVGSPSSSNSRRLRELAQKLGTPAHLIDSADDIRREWLELTETVGVTAGASAPEVLVAAVVARLREWGAESVEENPGRREDVVFPVPKNLRGINE
ncbi:1-hydroxy-2-methyl-2-(E)-butenyl 4-diphosphate reductase [Gammaproteobacteria bacterium]